MPPRQVHLNGDVGRLAQVVVNLLNNSAKYMAPGGRIWLSAERIPPDPSVLDAQEEVRISVRDAGDGIDAELLPRVFDMFAQGSQASESARGGLGIGLALVKSLVEMHDGRIEARSPGLRQGSEFVIHLPIAPHAFKGQPVVPDSPPAEVPVEIPPRRILVVDDNHDQAQSLAMLLRLMGHEVEVAHDGHAAIELAERMVPEMALLDIGLPGINGYAVARRIREQPRLRGMTLVAQTGLGQTDDRLRSQEAGFDHHLVKPLDLDNLQRILASLPSTPPGEGLA